MQSLNSRRETTGHHSCPLGQEWRQGPFLSGPLVRSKFFQSQNLPKSIHHLPSNLLTATDSTQLVPALHRAPGHLPFSPLCHADRTSTRPETAGPTRDGGPRQLAHLLATIPRASCTDTSSVPGPPRRMPSLAPSPSPGSPGACRTGGSALPAHFFPLSVQLLPELLQSRLLLGIQESLLSLLRGLQLFLELLQRLSAPLLQAGPLSPLEGLQLFSQPLQGSLLLGPERTDRWNGAARALRGQRQGAGSRCTHLMRPSSASALDCTWARSWASLRLSSSLI